MTPETRHRLLTVFDQGLSSLTNFVPAIYAAHVLEPREFGAFGLLQFVYVMALGVLRSSFVEVAMVSDSSNTPTRHHLGSVDAVLGVSLVTAVVAVPIALATLDVPPAAVVLMVTGFVIALAQDAVRLVAITVGRGGVAAVNDGMWLACICFVLAMTDAVLHPSPGVLAAAWTLSAAPGLVYGALAIGWRPSVSRGRWFVSSQPRLSAAFLGEWSIATGVTQSAIYALGFVGGILTVAQIRASQLLLGPLNIGFSGVLFAVTRSVMELRDTSLPAMRRLLYRLSLGTGTICLGVGGLIAVVPTAWLALVVGDQADGVVDYVLPMSLALAASGFSTGSVLGLRALRAGRRLTTTRVVTSGVIVGAGVAGYVATGTALGGLWGFSVGGLLAIPMWVRRFETVFRESTAIHAMRTGAR